MQFDIPQCIIEKYAKTRKIKIVREFYSTAFSGADPIDFRKGFADMLAYTQGDGAKTILVENASRFARDLTVQLTGQAKIQDLRFELIPVGAPSYFTKETRLPC